MSSHLRTINQALNAYSHLISDVGMEIALPGEPKVGWKKYSKFFCDNIILWALYNNTKDVDKQRKTSVRTILSAFEDLNVDRSMIKVLRQGLIHQGGFLDGKVLDKYVSKTGSMRKVGYFCIKVTLHDFKLVSLVDDLKAVVDDLADCFIFLHDLDITTDCRRVTSRPILQQYLENKFGDDIEIVNDLEKVGNHCISWITTTGKEQKVRCKVYNKLVQMLESADNASSLGSRMESLVMPVDKKFHRRLRKAKETGLSRLEVTFYGIKVYDLTYYEEYMEQVKEQLQDCKTYKVPYKEYWRYMASNISSMVGVLVRDVDEDEDEKATFAYCHWWNSVTKKKYGSYRSNVKRDEAIKLLANYSFNDRPIYFLEVDLQDPKKNIVVTKYMRPDGCKEITLVAGRQNSLYPRRYHEGVYSFKSMGIKTRDNITIKWPKRRLRKSSPPIVEIFQVPLDDDDAMYMQVGELVGHKASYKPGHTVLEERTKYTVIAAVKGDYRGRDYIFATLSNGTKVRCGRCLEAKITRWWNAHPPAQAPALEFTTRCITRVRGYTDIAVV